MTLSVHNNKFAKNVKALRDFYDFDWGRNRNCITTRKLIEQSCLLLDFWLMTLFGHSHWKNKNTWPMVLYLLLFDLEIKKI